MSIVNITILAVARKKMFIATNYEKSFFNRNNINLCKNNQNSLDIPKSPPGGPDFTGLKMPPVQQLECTWQSLVKLWTVSSESYFFLFQNWHSYRFCLTTCDSFFFLFALRSKSWSVNVMLLLILFQLPSLRKSLIIAVHSKTRLDLSNFHQPTWQSPSQPRTHVPIKRSFPSKGWSQSSSGPPLLPVTGILTSILSS